jgi:hypothetical protein
LAPYVGAGPALRVATTRQAPGSPPRSLIAEGEGVPPDIEVLHDASAGMAGRDPQRARSVAEPMQLAARQRVEAPPVPGTMPVKARRPEGASKVRTVDSER